MRLTYSKVGLDPSDTGFIEAHGTGTQAWDTAEMQAIVNVFSSNRKHDLFVGSLKSNIGHLESASGLASVVKTILVLEKGIVPPNLGSGGLYSALKFKDALIKVCETEK